MKSAVLLAVNPYRSSHLGSWSSWASGVAGSLVSGYIKDLSMGLPRAECLTRRSQDPIHPATLAAMTIRYFDFIDGEQTCAFQLLPVQVDR